KAGLSRLYRGRLLHRPLHSERANVTVINRSGSAPGLPISDLVYVNAGAPRVVTAWLDALADGGRLIFPLTAGFSMGSMLLVTRHGGAFAARFTSPASFIPYIGAEDPGADERLSLAYRSGAAQDVKSLLRGAEPPDDSCWLAGDGWWLSRRGLSARN
ncbi:MAG: hypothetical protein O3B74_07535, partial [Proteobacteria bacterium]|nr:hypothetical protein [Pseudomonadota bacterium]